MSSLRAVVCVALVGAVAVCCAPVLSQEHESGGDELRTAEKDLAKSAHEDPNFQSTASDPLSVDPDLALWTLVVFVILLIVLGKFAWGPIIAGLERREKSISDHIADAQRNHEEAKKLLGDYEKKLALAANEVRELLEEARRDAEHTKQSILAEAKAGAEAERNRALHDIDAATEGALKSLAERSAELAIDLAGKILQSKLSPADHERLIQEAMAKFPDSTPSAN
ncbi:MAG: F0F1 ATP synthase subunit B [Pirellulales bacterium]